MSCTRLTLEDAEALVQSALQRCRTSEINARSVARALVAAEADGLMGHGLSRVPSYCSQSLHGKVDGSATPTIDGSRPCVMRIDARYGFAYPALDLAVDRLPDAVRQHGIAAAAIHRSHHCGVAGHPVERLAEHGLVGLFFANSPAAVAPSAGAHGLFGTNPIAFACPLPNGASLLVDLALSKVARGRILDAKRRGESIPEGWALDAEGQPTTDPDAALKGTMVPIGDGKGVALVLMVEILAAGLTGANFAFEATSFFDEKGPPPGTGQLIIGLDPVAFGGPATVARFAALATAVEAEPGAHLPGTRRHAMRAKARTEGLEVDAALLATIEAL
jgi:(2R)-3-sulfolactate dehydrogenase (NADP+)